MVPETKTEKKYCLQVCSFGIFQKSVNANINPFKAI